MTTRSVRRYALGVGERVYVELSSPTGPLLRVAASPAEGVVEFWDEHIDDGSAFDRVFQVFGTGHPIPSDAQWRGTTERTPSGFVWHLFELRGDST